MSTITDRGLRIYKDAQLDEETGLLMFLALQCLLNTNDEYMFLTGGIDILNSGGETFISHELAKTIVLRRLRIGGAPVEHAILEELYRNILGRASNSGATDGDKKRVDILFRGAAGEPILAIEIKRAFHDLLVDAVRMVDLLTMRQRLHPSLKKAMILAFSASTRDHNEKPGSRIEKLVGKVKQEGLKVTAGWMTRSSLFNPSLQLSVEQTSKYFTALGVLFETDTA